MNLQALEELERRLRVTSLRIFKSAANEDLIAWMRLQEEINRETLVCLQTLEHSAQEPEKCRRCWVNNAEHYCLCGKCLREIERAMPLIPDPNDHSTQKVRYCECGHVDGSHEDVDGRSPCGVSSCPCSEFRPNFAPSGSAAEEPECRHKFDRLLVYRNAAGDYKSLVCGDCGRKWQTGDYLLEAQR